VIHFQILGRSLRLTGTVEATLEAALRSRWDFPEYEHVAHPFGLEVEILDVPASIFPAELQATNLELPAGNLECRTLETVIWLGDTTVGVRAELFEQRLLIQAWGVQARNVDLLHLVIAEGLRASGLISLHASIAASVTASITASITARNGLAIAFLGPSGRGKTTTLLRSLEAGFVPVCEDFAWCDPITLEVFGFDRGLRLLPDTATFFEERFGIKPSIWQVDKWFVPYSSLNLKRQAVKLAMIALLERQPEHQSGFEALSKRQAALAFWEASGLPLLRTVQDRVSQQIAGMVARLEVRRLVLGQGPIPFDQVLGDPTQVDQVLVDQIKTQTSG
jgi:hypothetical protein